MVTTSARGTYVVRIEYFSGGEPFAVDTFHVDEPAGGEIETAAAAAAEASSYFNECIPDLSYAMTIVALDPEDPEPPPAGARAKPVCAHCGSDQLVRDASARWDIDTQDWAISGIYDCTTCDICSAESDDLARWVHAGHVTPLERFMRDLATELDTPELADDFDFAQFCLDNFRNRTVPEAELAWKARDRAAP